jgi:hypothetical protein
MAWMRSGTATSLSLTRMVAVPSSKVSKNVPSKPSAVFITAAVGCLRPQPTPKLPFAVSFFAIDASSSQVSWSPDGTSTPAEENAAVLANTT